MKPKGFITRPDTHTKGISLFTLAVILLSVPLFGWVKARPPISPFAKSGFAQKAVDFSLTDINKNIQSLENLKEKGLFLYFFDPTFHTTPGDLEKINKVYKENLGRKEAFEFLGFCSGCSKETTKQIADKHGIEFPLCPDPDMTVAKAYGAGALPLSLVISTWRTVKFEHVGAIPNMQDIFERPFQEFLGIRLGIWRYRYGTEDERKEFEKKLTPAQKIKRVDRSNEQIARMATQVPCICDQHKHLGECTCDRHYQKALYTWMNFFLKDGSLTEEQIVQVLQWKAEGLKHKFAAQEKEGKP